ncbi:zinc ribbon domain-containing protein [Streptomyces sp. NPDC102437]|uniref:zinc ribbon domain-containing protein n=1 Tax=Streptomyces sp. NPDC102437 TaxID=3366175 RepID=UPI003815D7AA
MISSTPARVVAGRATTHRTHHQENPVTYYCDDCDAEFEAPTDTATVRCPGCGEMADKVTTPADELRAADARLRALATAASTDTDGTPTTQWSTAPCWPNDPDGTSRLYGDYLTRDDGRRIAWPPLLHGGSQQRPTRMQTQHADYIALMGPGLGLALADWLNAAAKFYNASVTAAANVWPETRDIAERDAWVAKHADGHALAVARQILGAGQGPKGLTAGHVCDNCDGIDPSTCLTNPERTAPAGTEEPGR